MHGHLRLKQDAWKMMYCGAGLARAASMGYGPTTATRALLTTHTTAATRPMTSAPLRLVHSKGCMMTGPAALAVRTFTAADCTKIALNTAKQEQPWPWHWVPAEMIIMMMCSTRNAELLSPISDQLCHRTEAQQEDHRLAWQALRHAGALNVCVSSR